MYIRKKINRNASTGKVYSYFQLVESRKTEKGPRVFVVLYLGVLDINSDEQKILSTVLNHRIKGLTRTLRFSDKIEELAEQIYLKYLRKRAEGEVRDIDKSTDSRITFTKESMEMGYHRSVGAELIGLHYWRALKFDEVLSASSFTPKEIEIAKVVILGRLISPGSEMHTLGWFNRQSSLSEYSRFLRGGLKKDTLYRIGDLIHAHKDKIEMQLRENLKELHSLVDKVYLYDLTNTYFEGNMLKSELCKRGKSKEKRNDCPLVTLALVVDQSGFPVYSRIYKGNQSEPGTLKDILYELYESEDDIITKLTKPAIVMDRGIATKENIAYLKEKSYAYFVIERRNQVEDYREEFSDIESFEMHKTKDEAPLYLKKVESEEYTRVLVYSEGKESKERSIVNKQKQRFLEDAGLLISSNQKGYIKDMSKILVRIGRLKEKYGSTASLYDFQMTKDKENPCHVKAIILSASGKSVAKAEFPGCYVIETDQKSFSAKEVWDFYMKLSEVEASFRAMKSQLGTRPVYHQKDERIESHLFISVLAYAIMKSIVFNLKQKGYRKSWLEIKKILSTHMRSSLIITDINGDKHQIRQNGTPEPEAAELFSLLGIPTSKNQHSKTLRV